MRANVGGPQSGKAGEKTGQSWCITVGGCVFVHPPSHTPGKGSSSAGHRGRRGAHNRGLQRVCVTVVVPNALAGRGWAGAGPGGPGGEGGLGLHPHKGVRVAATSMQAWTNLALRSRVCAPLLPLDETAHGTEEPAGQSIDVCAAIVWRCDCGAGAHTVACLRIQGLRSARRGSCLPPRLQQSRIQT